MPAPLSAPELLDDSHILEGFDCGTASLNDWLKRYARQNQRKRGARTYVAHREKVVAGYYSLAAGGVEPKRATGKVGKGLSKLVPVPVILLARLAVDSRERGIGLGKGLLNDALLRCARASDELGARAVVVDAIDAGARGFYEKYGFERSPIDEFRLMLLIRDIEMNMGRGLRGS